MSRDIVELRDDAIGQLGKTLIFGIILLGLRQKNGICRNEVFPPDLYYFVIYNQNNNRKGQVQISRNLLLKFTLSQNVKYVM